MIGHLIKSVGLIINRRWWCLIVALLLWYIIYLFISAIGPPITAQLNLWGGIL